MPTTRIKTSIVIDDREVSSGVIPILEGCDGVTTKINRLPLGDYEIDGRLLVERKTLLDLTVSIKDGRLFAQALRLAESPLLTAILLEGTGRDLAASGMRREAVQGALVTLTLYLGIPILRSRDIEESVRLMLYAARQGQAIAQNTLHRKGQRPQGKRRLQSHVLQGLPGIGPERAKRLLEYFGDIESVVNANLEDLAQVPGVGATTAKAIRWAVKEPGFKYATNDTSALAGSSDWTPRA